MIGWFLETFVDWTDVHGVLIFVAGHCLTSWNTSPSEVESIYTDTCRWLIVRSKSDNMYILTDYNLRQIETKCRDCNQMISG
jgi:hypothetical protein